MKLTDEAPVMITPARLSYGVLGVTIILAGLLHLGTPLLAVLFSYLALRQSYFLTKRKWLALIPVIVTVAGVSPAGAYFNRAPLLSLSELADTSLPPRP